MRSSITSLILAFCAMVAVQGAAVETRTAIAAPGDAFSFDAVGDEIEARGAGNFEFDAQGINLSYP